MKYDKKSIKSVFEYSFGLIGKSLEEAVTLPSDVANSRNRGDLGSLVEKYFFEHVPPNNHDPDFAEIRLELKTTGLEKYQKAQKTGQVYRVKERLVLTSINYDSLRKESWEESNLIKKCGLMLILFYEYNRKVAAPKRKFILNPMLIYFPVTVDQQYEKALYEISPNVVVVSKEDMAQIKRDWEFIQRKVLENKAHELSEGDTYYLGACRKGAGGEKEVPKKQHGSEIAAMGRAFAFKPSYMRTLIQNQNSAVGSLGVNSQITFENATLSKFDEYIGLSVEEISKKLNYFSSAKHIKSLLSRRILDKAGGDVLELMKADIILKTLSLTKTGKAREDISFPAFKYLELAEQNWEESDFADQIESRFLFVVFQVDTNGVDRLVAVKYWTMPYEDRMEVRRVWETAKLRVKDNASQMPRKSESKISHVRPHGKNRRDTDLTPQGIHLQKKCFWLNGNYVAQFVR